jgi:hypothetical protein
MLVNACLAKWQEVYDAEQAAIEAANAAQQNQQGT